MRKYVDIPDNIVAVLSYPVVWSIWTTAAWSEMVRGFTTSGANNRFMLANYNVVWCLIDVIPQFFRSKTDTRTTN